MYCPSSILINFSRFMVILHTKGDYNKNEIPLSEYFKIWNYELAIFRNNRKNGRKHFRIRWNYDNNRGHFIESKIYRLLKAISGKSIT